MKKNTEGLMAFLGQDKAFADQLMSLSAEAGVSALKERGYEMSAEELTALREDLKKRISDGDLSMAAGAPM
jgi:predicted ribosomally synthesized peptide with nif11-like leader